MRIFLVVPAALAALAGSALAAPDAEVAVPMDESRTIRLDRAVSTVVIGNPSIADVALRGPQIAFITGRSFGITNLIALDNSGAEVANFRVIVGASQGSSIVVLHRGSADFNYSCAPRCELFLNPGDAMHQKLATDVQTKVGLGLSTQGDDAGATLLSTGRGEGEATN